MAKLLEERAREIGGHVLDSWQRKRVIRESLAHLTHVQAEAREQLAAWMIEHSFATGHGDTFEDLLKELEWQVKEVGQKARLAALEEATRIAEKHIHAKRAAIEIRALAQASCSRDEGGGNEPSSV